MREITAVAIRRGARLARADCPPRARVIASQGLVSSILTTSSEQSRRHAFAAQLCRRLLIGLLRSTKCERSANRPNNRMVPIDCPRTRERFFLPPGLRRRIGMARVCSVQTAPRSVRTLAHGGLPLADLRVSRLSSDFGAVPMSTQDDADLERELDMLMAKAGAQAPAERKAGIVAGS